MRTDGRHNPPGTNRAQSDHAKESRPWADDRLELENQLCFPFYACSREVVRRYKPFLDPLGLTYTQYIVMPVLWERRSCTVREPGEAPRLDYGTLTPLLKKLEAKGCVARERSHADERNLIVSLTEEGRALKAQAAEIPQRLLSCIPLDEKDATELRLLLYKMLAAMDGQAATRP